MQRRTDLGEIVISYPLGILAISVLLDYAGSRFDNESLFIASHWMIAIGVISGFVVTLLAIGTPPPAAENPGRPIGALHRGTLGVLVLFAVSWFLRAGAPADPGAIVIASSVVATTLAAMTGWLGGELAAGRASGISQLDGPRAFSKRPESQHSRAV